MLPVASLSLAIKVHLLQFYAYLPVQHQVYYVGCLITSKLLTLPANFAAVHAYSIIAMCSHEIHMTC